jgi:hypothetical protein
MRQGLRGNPLPESEEDFKQVVSSMREQRLNCLECKTLFTEANVHSAAGWRETQISGYCEDCYDELFKEPT